MIGGTEQNGEKNLISTREQFRFNGLICEWRENIIQDTLRIHQCGNSRTYH